MERRRALEATMRRVFRSFNYREVQTPGFEELELFLAKSGPGIREELYDFKDKGGREIALRPELTAPVMRFYFTSLRNEPKPLRLFYFGPCYRYDRPQAGRYREFWQMGCELVGDEEPAAHAELIALAARLFDESGLKNYVLRIGHLGFLRGWLKRLGYAAAADQGPLMRLIDKKELDKVKDALAGGNGKPEDVRRFIELFAIASQPDAFARLRLLAGDAESEAAVAHLATIRDHLEAFGIDPAKIRLDPTIARGLEYYTGLVFELDAPDLGAEKQLLGGGAYDLSGVFEQAAVATAGFALGFDRTLVALEKAGANVTALEHVDAYVGFLDAAAQKAAIRVATDLRTAGRRVELESRPVAAKKLFTRASSVGARYAVLIGAKELARGVAAVKDLTSGEQADAPLERVAERVRG